MITDPAGICWGQPVAVLARNGFHGFSLDVFKPTAPADPASASA